MAPRPIAIKVLPKDRDEADAYVEDMISTWPQDIAENVDLLELHLEKRWGHAHRCPLCHL